MARFKIIAGVPDFSGTVGEAQPTRFEDGCAEIDVVDQMSANRLAYFLSAGYGVEPLDGKSAVYAIRKATSTPEAEAAYLEGEIKRLEKVDKLDDLRARHAELVRKAEESEADNDRDPQVTSTETGPEKRNPPQTSRVASEGGPEIVELPKGSTVGSTPNAPADTATVAEWRAYGVEHLGLSQEQADRLTKAQIQVRAKEAGR